MSLFSAFGQMESIAKTIGAVWPAVDAFVKQVESSFPVGSPGSTKLAAVKSFVSATWATVDGIVVSFESAWPTLEALVTALVAAYNTIGLFNHKPAGT